MIISFNPEDFQLPPSFFTQRPFVGVKLIILCTALPLPRASPVHQNNTSKNCYCADNNAYDFLEDEIWLCDGGFYHNENLEGDQEWTRGVDGSLSVFTPTPSDCEVSSDHGAVFESPLQFLCSAIVPNLSLTAYEHSGGENLTEDSLTTPETSTNPSSTNASSPPDRTRSETIFSSYSEDSPSVRLDIKTCEICQIDFDGSENLINHLYEKHSNNPTFCGRKACRTQVKPWNRRELKRHLDASKVHRSAATPLFQCRCKRTFPRRSIFRTHLRKLACKGEEQVVCWCIKVTSNYVQPSDIQAFDAHVESCGLGSKGRPPKKRKGTTQKEKIVEEMFAPEGMQSSNELIGWD